MIYNVMGGVMFKFFDGDHFKNNFIYLLRFLAVPGLRCCTRYSLAVVCRCAVASLEQHRF